MFICYCLLLMNERVQTSLKSKLLKTNDEKKVQIIHPNEVQIIKVFNHVTKTQLKAK